MTTPPATHVKPRRVNPLRPMHSSMVGRVHALVPSSIGTMAVSPEQRDAVERVALETFTDMVNSGHTFQQALGTIYMSGMVHALEASR